MSGIRKKKFNNEEYEILDHDAVPGYRTAFHIIIVVAVAYFIYIFASAAAH